MRGLGQVEWEYDVLSESTTTEVTKALEKAFPNGDYPQYVNYPPEKSAVMRLRLQSLITSSKVLKTTLKLLTSLTIKLSRSRKSSNIVIAIIAV